MESGLGIRSFSPSFKANVAQHFINTAHNYYNFTVVANRMKHVYSFNNKVQEYSKFGFDNYTLDYARKMVDGNYIHYLVANDSDTNKSVIVLTRRTLPKIINGFFYMSKEKFQQIMRSNKHYL